jgi:flagellar biosynthesis GTPase FlhF
MVSLAEAGMPTAMRTLFLDTIKNMSSEEEALIAIQAQLVHSLERPTVPVPETGVHLIAGPSGAGKTLMTARLASRAGARIGAHNVAIISYQDGRLGAWSQTQMLSAQIGVDCFRAEDPAKLDLLLEELSRRGLIIIDTPGVQMGTRISEVLALCPGCLCHAIVPADASQATLKRVLISSGVSWQSFMLSKLDESAQAWPLLQYMCNNLLSFSSASDGNRITDLRCDVTPGVLVELAIANLTSRAPVQQIPIRKQMQFAVSSSHRLFTQGSPRGLRGPFN